jgi:hypothetical protein
MSPIFDELQIDIAMQGHGHVYEVIGPVRNKQLVANPVSNQQTVPIHPRENLTGKFSGTFNTQEGTLYFLNNCIGTKSYDPKPLDQMDNVGTTGITNYRDLFTGRYGQGGNSTFSNITVTTDTIFITTYESLSNGSTNIFDKFKVVKPTNPLRPVITINTQPAENTNVFAGSINGSISVVARVTQNATISYQWYSKTSISSTGGTSLGNNARNATFTIPKTLAIGTYYYYCILNASGGANPVSSDVATVKVVSANTATEDHFAQNLKVNPIPFSEITHLTGVDVETGHVPSLRVINAAGVVVHTQMITSSDETLQLGHLPKGVYFFLLEKEGKTKTLKVVKD